MDIRTILVSFAVCNAACTVLIGVLWFTRRKEATELHLWVVNFFLQTVSIVLISLRGLVPDAISMVGGNAIGLLGTILLLIGLERHLGIKGRHIQNWLFLVFFTAVQAYFSLVKPILVVRNINVSFGLLIISGQTAWLLLRRVSRRDLKATWPVGFVFCLYAFFSAIRIVSIHFINTGNDYLRSGIFDAVLLLVYQMLSIALIFSIFLMLNRQMSMDLEEGREKRELAERELRKSEEKFSAAFHNIPDAVVLTSRAEGKILDANDAFVNLFGFSRDELLESSTIKLRIWDREMDREIYINEIMSKNRARNMEMRFRRKSGEVFSGQISGEVLKLEEGVYLLNIIHDMTDRKKLEEEIYSLNADLDRRIKQRTAELEISNKELESFSYSVSHDLRAPLRSIEGFSYLLKTEFSGAIPAPGQEYFQRIQNAAQRMGQLIDGMLRLARISRTQLHLQDIDINALAADVAVELARSNPERNVELKIEPGLVAKADQQLLHIVITNLMENAYKFTSKRETGHIEIGKVLDPDKGVVFFVRDDGAGFDETYKDKLFIAFQRLHGQNEFSGTGIGLATAQRAIRRHGGEVWAEGRVDQGATFYFTIPA